MKLSPGKITEPGAKQVYRGQAGDVLALSGESAPPGHEPLLVPVMRGGPRLAAREPLQAAQRRCAADLAWLPPEAKALRVATAVRVTVSPQLTGAAGAPQPGACLALRSLLTSEPACL